MSITNASANGSIGVGSGGTGTSKRSQSDIYSYSTGTIGVTGSGFEATRKFAKDVNSYNVYSTYDVSDDFVRRLRFYTEAMIHGDMKEITTEYLLAIMAILQTVQNIKRPLTSNKVEQLWAVATEMKGSLPEDFARAIQNELVVGTML